MSDNEKNIGANEEFEGKEVKNNIPQIDEDAYNQINQKSRNIRNFDDDDDYYNSEEEEEEIQPEDNDIINSLLKHSQDAEEEGIVEDESESKFSFKKGKKKGAFSGLSFGKKKKADDLEESEEPEENEKPLINKKPKKEKKAFSFSKKKNKKIDETPIDEVLPEEDINDEENEDYVNTIEDIERDIRKAKKNEKGGDKKIFIVGGAVLGVFLVGGLVSMFLFGGNKKPIEEQTPPPVVEIEQEENEFTSSGVEDISYKQGKIKRILGNKVSITPDGETEKTIYYVDNMDIISKFKAGSHVEYGYVIKNYLPYITEMVEIREGIIAYKGIMTINIMVDDTLVKFAYDSSLSEDIKDLSTGDTIQYVYNDIDGTPTVTNIINIIKGKVDEEGESNPEFNPENNPMTDDLYNGYVYDAKDFYDEYMIIDAREEETRTAVKTQIHDNTISFYNGLSGPIWIRHAWRSTDLMETVPSIENVNVILETPSGVQITNKNIDEYGRMWLDGSILNYAIKNPEIGEYKFIDNKANGTFLGEASIHVMELTGFITIDKFGANLIDRDTLELVWNITGVPDDGLEMEVYLTNDRFSTMVFSGSSKNEPLHLIDKRVVSIANLPKGKYNVIVKVKDIDMKTQADNPEIAENTIVITAETIIENKNVGILILQ